MNWQTDRKSKASRTFSFSTPLLIDVKGQKQVISPASDVIAAYDPKSGDEIWRIRYDGYSVIPAAGLRQWAGVLLHRLRRPRT